MAYVLYDLSQVTACLVPTFNWPPAYVNQAQSAAFR